MTIKEKLGYEITNTLLTKSNDKIRNKEEKFLKEFLKIEDEIKSTGKSLIKLEEAFDEYIEILKIEFYNAGAKINDILCNMNLEENSEEYSA